MQKEINKKNIFKIIQNNHGITTRGIHDILEQNTKRYHLEVEEKAQVHFTTKEILIHLQKKRNLLNEKLKNRLLCEPYNL